jgi:hypothetical protein
VNAKKLAALVVVAFVLAFVVTSPVAARGIANDGMKIGTHVFFNVTDAIKQFTGHQDK